MSVGSIFLEIDLDASRFERNQQKLIKSATTTSLSIEKNFQNLGVKSDAIYEAMRRSATNSLEMIKAKSTSTGNEIARAQQAHAEQIKRINEQQFGHQATLLETMKKNWLATTAVITAAYFAVSRAWNFAEQAAQYEQSRSAFRGMAQSMGADAEEVFGKIKRLSSGLIDDKALTQSMNTALSLGIPIEKLGDLMTIARAKSRDMGITATQAFDDIARGIGRGSPLILDNLGLMLKLGSANEAMAAAVGKTVDQLTDKEKKLAILNATIDAGKEALSRHNLELLTMKERLDALKVQITDIKLIIGDVLLRLGAGLVATFQSVASFGTAVAGLIMGPIIALVSITDHLGITKGKAEEYKIAMDAMAASAQDLAEKANRNFELMRLGMKEVSAPAPRRGTGGDDKGDGADKAAAEIARKAREKEVAKMWAEEGKLVHDALMAEAGMTQEYHDTLRKLDDEAWAEEKKMAAAIVELDRKRYAEEGAIAMDALAAEMGMTQEYLDTVRGMRDAEFEAWKEINDPAAMADFYDSIVGYEQEAHDRKVALIEAERDARIAAGIDATAAAKKASQEIGELDQKMFEKKARQVFDAAGDMAYAFDAIGSMYDKNSAEYAKMQEAAKAMIVLQQAVAVANAVATIANQGLGDPYTAFARIAAMAAAMGSLLASAGMSFGGGGASSAAALPASTVLGAEAGTGSESISKSLELLEDTYNLEYRELTGIHNSMKELNTNITALVTSIVRTGTVGTGAGISGLGFDPGKAQQWAMSGMGKAYVSSMSPMNLFGGLPFTFMDNKITDIANRWFSDAIGSIFGGGTSKSLEGTGIEFKGQTVGRIIAGEYMDAVSYALIKTVKDGGWFHSDKTSYQTIYKALDGDVSRLFHLVFQNMSTTLAELAKGLGSDVDAVLAYQFKGERINLKGMTGEEIDKTLSEYFSKVGDVAVEALFGELITQYQQLNEGLFETAARLVVDKAIVTEILTMTNQGFPGSTAAVIAFSEAIIKMAGGLEELQDAAATYYDKFFSDAEKQVRLQGQLSDALSDLNLFLPATRDGYRAIVEALDLSTDAGKEAYVSLLKWSGAADDYYSAVEDAADGTIKLTESLKKQSAAIQAWLNDINLSSLAPVVSREAFSAEYERQKTLATAPGATEGDLSSFLGYAKEYLQFMRTYGGDYQAVFDAVVGDVAQLGEVKDAQVAAIQAADAAARDAAARQIEMLRLQLDLLSSQTPYLEDMPRVIRTLTEADRIARDAAESRYIPEYAIGGLTYGPSMAGERGQEWVVPTYEPQRSRFLENVPPQFWENLHGGGVSQGGGGDITVRVPVYLDGKVVADVVAKHVQRNANLADAIKRAVN